MGTYRPRGGTGWAFPVRPGMGGGIPLVGEEEAIERALLLILHTRHGERVMRPGFGCRAHSLLFRPLSRTVLDAVSFQVEEAIRQHEDRVRVEEVRAERHPQDAAAVQVTVRYRILRTGSPAQLALSLFPSMGAPSFLAAKG